jgi:hypothetical protein
MLCSVLCTSNYFFTLIMLFWVLFALEDIWYYLLLLLFSIIVIMVIIVFFILIIQKLSDPRTQLERRRKEIIKSTIHTTIN